MEWLNYHHLLYFWMVAKHGGITKACERLRLRPPTLSAQIRLLEDSLGEKLFAREGRRLVLTETGRLVYGYAEEIFSLGREMVDAVKRGAGPFGLRLVVGVADAVPKIVALKLLELRAVDRGRFDVVKKSQKQAKSAQLTAGSWIGKVLFVGLGFAELFAIV